MKKSLFALARAACFALGASEFEKFEKECNDGNMESCYFAAYQHEDSAKKHKLFKKACDGGEDLACNAVIVKIINEDPKEGIKFAERKCSEGSGISCLNLGMLYHAGEFVEKI